MSERSKYTDNPENFHDLGEWFNPFLNYMDIVEEFKNDEVYSLRFPTEINGIGKLVAKTFWSATPGDDISTYLVSLSHTEAFKLKDIGKLEEQLSTRLISIGFAYMGDLSPFSVQVRLGEDGTCYNGDFSFEQSLNLSYIADDQWRTLECDPAALVYPEEKQVLDRVQVRILPIQDGGGEE